MSQHNKRVLFVSYLFPPTGGVGVQRVTKFVKHLAEFGWTPSVLTAANPSVPLKDDSLCRDVPAGTIVRTARTREPGYRWKQSVGGGGASSPGPVGTLRDGLRNAARSVANTLLQPDPQILWRSAAIRTGLELLRETPHQAIIATGPPFSTFLVGAALSRQTRLPLVLDYRDEWSISNRYWENKRQGWLSNQVQSRMQRSVLRAADVVMATTPSSATALAELAADSGSFARTTWIYNGFDPDDFRAGTLPPELTTDPVERSRCFRLTCVGTLWNLNPIGPVVRAVRRLIQTAPQLAPLLQLVFVGRRTPEQEAELDLLNGTPVTIRRLPFVAHDQAVAAMLDADALLLLNADVPHAERIINAKAFEYVAARRPVLVVAPRGDLWNLLEDVPESVLRRPADTAGIADALTRMLQQFSTSGRTPSLTGDISMYERREQAGELAVLLDDLERDEPPTMKSALEARLTQTVAG
ncbi:MAG: glycosyltransferase [Planctomycetaceae bacterium]|nr:glycosyltransferase [Planctomycetaceae bacterium]